MVRELPVIRTVFCTIVRGWDQDDGKMANDCSSNGCNKKKKKLRPTLVFQVFTERIDPIK
jgi:hypothetical protein